MLRRCLPVLLIACSTPAAKPQPAPAQPCMFGGKWSEQPRELRLTPDGKPFATLFDVTSAKVTIDTGVRALLVTPSVRIGGYVSREEFHLHASKPFLAGGFIVPAPDLAMKLVASTAANLEVEIPLPYGATGKPVREQRSCGDFAIEPRTFEPRDAISAPMKRDGYLTENQAIPLSLEPGKPPIVELHYEDGLGVRVEIVEERDQLVRVVVGYNHVGDPSIEALLVGWIPASAIHHEAHGVGGSWARGGEPGRPRARTSKNPRVTCPNEVSLDVELDGQRKTVGVVMPNVVIELAGGDEVALPETLDVSLQEGARWLIAHQALASCTTK